MDLFRIALGGATGHKAFARDLGVLVPPAEFNKVLVAMMRVYHCQWKPQRPKEGAIKTSARKLDAGTVSDRNRKSSWAINCAARR